MQRYCSLPVEKVVSASGVAEVAPAMISPTGTGVQRLPDQEETGRQGRQARSGPVRYRQGKGRCLQDRRVEGSCDHAGIACKTCKDFSVLQACLTFAFQNDRNAAAAAYHRPRR